MELLRTVLGDDIVTVVKSFLDNDEWNYLNDDWELIKEIPVFATRTGRLDLLIWDKKTGKSYLRYTGEKGGPFFDGRMSIFAAANGHLEILKWLKENGDHWTIATCSVAAANGQLKVLKWLVENGGILSAYACEEAARYGQLEVLKWSVKKIKFRLGPWIYPPAIHNKQVKIIKWLKENEYPE